jgi:signal peptidase I
MTDASFEQPAAPEPQKHSTARAHIRLWLRDVLVSVAASFMIITFLYQPVRVEGTSMQPELRDQQIRLSI